MKKGIIIAAAAIGLLALGGGGAFAASQISRSTAVSEDTAVNFACIDAGVTADEITLIRVDFDYERGRYVYDIDFIAGGIKYEYTVDSGDGSIIDMEREPVTDTSLAGYIGNQSGTENTISVTEAREIALKKAKLAESDVIITKSRLEYDDGRAIYDIEFYLPDKYEYDYEIDALTGDIIEESVEKYDKKVNPDTALSGSVPSDPASGKTSSPGGNSASAISVDEAKRIALEKAGLTSDGVIFEKAKMERDDGRTIYDIEFYIIGQKEYEYEIDAYTGEILDEEIDNWDSD